MDDSPVSRRIFGRFQVERHASNAATRSTSRESVQCRLKESKERGFHKREDSNGVNTATAQQAVGGRVESLISPVISQAPVS